MFDCNKRKKYILPYIETHLVDHCNLKCDKCGYFCHLIDEEFYTDVEQFNKDLNVLSKKVDFYRIRLLGGEPLLHSSVNDFMIITRTYFPFSDIRIVTNGILLPTMNKTFWDTVRRYRIKIDLSKYPILGNKFSELLDLIDDEKAMLGNIQLSKRFYDKLNEQGNADAEKSYFSCASRKALNLWNQKIYTCQACYRYYYNRKFNKNIPLPKGVDIYETSAKDIFKIFNLDKPDNACKYCYEISKEFPWHLYKDVQQL